VALSEGHCTRLEPTIEYFRDSLEHASAFLGGDLNFVNKLSVDISERAAARKTLELFNRTYNNNFFSII